MDPRQRKPQEMLDVQGPRDHRTTPRDLASLPGNNNGGAPVGSPPTSDVARELWGVEALAADREAKRKLQAEYAGRRESWIEANRYYYESVRRLFRFIIEPGKHVLNLRCHTGHFLEAVRPSRGVGVEISQEMVEIARRKYPHSLLSG